MRLHELLFFRDQATELNKSWRFLDNLRRPPAHLFYCFPPRLKMKYINLAQAGATTTVFLAS